MSNINQQTALLIDGLKTVGVHFYEDRRDYTKGYSGKTYSYKTLESLSEGDLVVVDVSGQMKVVKVVELHTVPNIEKATKWIVGKVNTETYEKTLVIETELANKLEEIKNQTFRKQAIQALADDAQMSYEEIQDLTRKITQPLLENK